jgi:energy-coupling factor transporter ATP-binding protein EcfA2
MYVNSIKIKNFRCFKKTEITLQNPNSNNSLKFKNINILLGNNGSGKSSVLRALALSTLSPVLERSSGLVLTRMVRNTGHSPNGKIEDAELTSDVVLHEQDLKGFSRKKTVTIEMKSRLKRRGSLEELHSETSEKLIPIGIFEDYSPAFLVVGYGVTRRVEESTGYNFKEQSKSRRVRYSRVADLFDNNYKLVPLPSWLPQLESENKGRYTQVVHLIDRLTPSDMDFEGKFIEGEFYFNFRGIETSFGALSDGYKGFIGWIGDLLYHICMGCPAGKKLVESCGLVLVDEIDLLLHPEWQRGVIQTLSENLPKLQFVFTTHSPIVASSVETKNVFVMETTTDGSAIVKQYDENIYGLTSEQVLLSSYFDLETTRPKSFMQSEIEPLSDKAMHGDHEASLEIMRKLSKPITIDKSKFNDIMNKF